MPLYEYQCQKCKVTHEAIQRFSEAPFTICEQCGGELRKLISSPAIQFKGAGWYVNDYGKSGSSKGSSSSDKGSSESSSSESSSSEASSKKSSEGSAKSSEGTTKSGESKPSSE